MKITAIIPIKHTSTRVPGKNFRLMNGKPLFYYIINTLLKVKSIDNIVIDTNSPIIFEQVPSLFAEHMHRIIIYRRPEHLCPGDTPTNELLLNIIDALQLDSDYYLQTHVTNPLLEYKTVENAITKFLSNQNMYECLFSVKTHYTRLYDKNGNDMNHNRFKLIPTQDLDPIYEENSCIYLFTKDILNKFKARIGENAMLFPMTDFESQDIDWEEDFVLTEMLMKIKDDNKI
jgi:CMP-N-acetylneuraminic acid synthetase